MLVFKNVKRRIAGEPLLEGVSLTHSPGRPLAILGVPWDRRRVLRGLLAGADRVDSGAVLLDGADIRKARRARSGKAVRVVATAWTGSPGDTVGKALRSAGARKDQVVDACGRAGLAGREAVRLKDLTAGERVRLAFAAALAADPGLVVADSPLDGLSGDERAAILKDLPAIFGETGAVVVWIANAADEALALGARAVVLQAGRVAQDGPAREVGEHPATLDVARLFWGEALNILPLTIQSDGCRLPDGSTLVLPGGFSLPASGAASLAVRADALQSDRKDAAALRFVVRVAGGEAPPGYAAVDFSGRRWLAPVAGGLPAAGMLASIYASPGQIMVFGADGRAAGGDRPDRSASQAGGG